MTQFDIEFETSLKLTLYKHSDVKEIMQSDDHKLNKRHQKFLQYIKHK